MKIHGTAKGAALSTKDFGVAFGGAAEAPEVCQDVTDAETIIQKYDGAVTGNKSGCGVRITDVDTGADFVGLTINTVKVWLRKNVGAPDNSFSVGIYRNEGAVDTVLYNFHDGDLSEITDSVTAVQYVYTGSGTHTIAAGDIVCVMQPHTDSLLYTKINNSTISGLEFAIFNDWPYQSSWPKWTFNTNASFAFCLK